MTRQQLITIIITAFLNVYFREIITGIVGLVKKIPAGKIKNQVRKVFNRTVLTIIAAFYNFIFFGSGLYKTVRDPSPITRVDTFLMMMFVLIILFWANQLRGVAKEINAKLNARQELELAKARERLAQSEARLAEAKDNAAKMDELVKSSREIIKKTNETMARTKPINEKN